MRRAYAVNILGAVTARPAVRLLLRSADPVGSPEAPGGSAHGAGRLPRVPQGRIHRGAEAVRDFPALRGLHPLPRHVCPPGAEPVLLLPQAGVLPDVPCREGGAEAEHEDGRPAGSHGAAPGGLPRHPPDRRAPRPRVLLPVPREQERRAGASSATSRTGGDMTTKMRSLRDLRNPIGCLILLAASPRPPAAPPPNPPAGPART